MQSFFDHASPSNLPWPGRRAIQSGILAAALALTACGGGGASGTGESTPSGGADRAVALAVDATGASTNDASGWTTIAVEGAHYTFDGTRSVRYGAGDAWITQTVTGGGDCTNVAFGSDPAYNVVKSCQVASTDATTWTTIASEGATFTVNGTQSVRYGNDDTWVIRTVTGSGACTNDYFGGDPLFNVVKVCQTSASTATSDWTRIAVEGASFTVSGTQTVRYGAGSAWITKSVTGSGACTNDYFGSDPAFNVVKECQVAATATTTAAVAGVCNVPAAPADTSTSVATVGDGTPGSCTEAALRAAVNAYPVVKFSCGASPVTIAIGTTIDVPPLRDTVIDGGGLVTLDGGNATRILSVVHSNYRTNSNGLTLQHIALANGRAPASGYVAPDPAHPQCAYGYAQGSGAAVYASDARLYVFDVDFRNNAAATPGPDVGGGAIYAAGSLDVLVAGSRFTANSGSNSGAVGMLNSNLRVYNSSFTGNAASGTGQNYQDASCPGIGHPGQAGAGGNGGAIAIDGGDDTDVVVCGSTFVGNSANELAGALGRTADIAARAMTIDRSLFRNNTAHQGGAFYLHNIAPLTIVASTFDSNRAVLFGAGQLDQTTFSIVNSTFTGNVATQGLAGALAFGGTGSSSVIQNATFAGNRADGGPGYFGAAYFGDSNFTVTNTLFANNTTGDPYNPMQCGFSASAGANTLQWPALRVVGGLPDTPCVSGESFVDPQLGTLADNGGPTPTLLPAAGSPARGAGHACPATDQRGNPRNPANCTIGAVE